MNNPRKRPRKSTNLSLAADHCSPGQFADVEFWDGLVQAIDTDEAMPARALTEADDEKVLAEGGRR